MKVIIGGAGITGLAVGAYLEKRKLITKFLNGQITLATPQRPFN